MSDSKKKKRSPLPKRKPVSELPDEEVMERLFSKRVVKKLKEVAHDNLSDESKGAKSSDDND